ncbi:Hypothetical_protein [Hexamita inflata]|uniref:Hypothetical_protein n=1 Tax=Hexamita inflata TaxID=28002 RepID=A0AA86TDF6_9EUKA|nr:Hypothetical protein HINF_LOCUS917 [Hexamita inflata]
MTQIREMCSVLQASVKKLEALHVQLSSRRFPQLLIQSGEIVKTKPQKAVVQSQPVELTGLRELQAKYDELQQQHPAPRNLSKYENKVLNQLQLLKEENLRQKKLQSIYEKKPTTTTTQNKQQIIKNPQCDQYINFSSEPETLQQQIVSEQIRFKTLLLSSLSELKSQYELLKQTLSNSQIGDEKLKQLGIVCFQIQQQMIKLIQSQKTVKRRKGDVMHSSIYKQYGAEKYDANPMQVEEFFEENEEGE